MSAYGALAPYYDSLMPAQAYRAWADCCEELARADGAHLLLDLACGTGTLTWLLAQRGYETIGVDLSCDMLACAMSKRGDYPEAQPPLFLQQSLDRLDLYGTVQGAVCSMDGMNYLPPDTLAQALKRVRLFLEPGGFFLFDVHTPEKLHSMDGRTFCSQSEAAYSVWNVTCPAGADTCVYDMDLFLRSGKLWRREREQHLEYVHPIQRLKALLGEAGFSSAEVLGGLPLRPAVSEDERLFFLCRA